MVLLSDIFQNIFRFAVILMFKLVCSIINMICIKNIAGSKSHVHSKRGILFYNLQLADIIGAMLKRIYIFFCISFRQVNQNLFNLAYLTASFRILTPFLSAEFETAIIQSYLIPSLMLNSPFSDFTHLHKIQSLCRIINMIIRKYIVRSSALSPHSFYCQRFLQHLRCPQYRN